MPKSQEMPELQSEKVGAQTYTLWCGFPGENHVVHLSLTTENVKRLGIGMLLLCPTHDSYNVGRMPKMPTTDAAET